MTRRGTLSEFKILNSDVEMDLKVYPWKFLEQRIRNGTWIGFVAEHMGEIIGYTFVSTEEMSVGGTKTLEFLLPPRSVYLTRGFIHPKYRNMSVGKQLESYRFDVLKASGIERAFGAVRAANAPEIHNCLKLNGVIAGTVTFFSTRLNNTAIVSRGVRKTGLKIKRVHGSHGA